MSIDCVLCMTYSFKEGSIMNNKNVRSYYIEDELHELLGTIKLAKKLSSNMSIIQEMLSSDEIIREGAFKWVNKYMGVSADDPINDKKERAKLDKRDAKRVKINLDRVSQGMDEIDWVAHDAK